ncbi:MULTISPECIES: class I SAM-dependent methyltransferase [Thiorhodovibrio]|uniref:class I SAM-dependent methyltransferase n=1 Tax=Thiorhodovibrio TaxID=61593 RepID=UPI0019123D29|nr:MULTISPECIES: class I SAM-dependent methyltransferase [Thiorhodovibrio]MBK5968622.1 hypothetical protein [Thiorhodovibrio winogradskyi]WPL11274.1 hypothetical protein Thiosp_01006 [Thiorhodovibrio litoralis]
MTAPDDDAPGGQERFSADWLSLREPVDHRSRSPRVLATLCRWAAGKKLLRVIDLGCGSGSNLRYLSPRLPVSQRWVCVDQDAELLQRLAANTPKSPQLLGLTTRVASLHTSGLLANIDASTLLTASALLDLVSEDWLADLVGQCQRKGAALLASTTYDGRVAIHPKQPEDNWIMELFNADQRRDKGMGPALGPNAAKTLRRIAQGLGFRLHQGSSDWQLERDDLEVARSLVAGWVEAVERQAPHQRGRITPWHRQRQDSLAAGELLIRVGHQDLFLEPSPTDIGPGPVLGRD